MLINRQREDKHWKSMIKAKKLIDMYDLKI